MHAGLWSYLAQAADAAPEAFERGVARGLEPGILHLLNSAGALEHPDSWFALVRCGAAPYGIETVVGRTHALEPAMRVISRVTRLKRVVAGTRVSYNHAPVAPVETTPALVPVVGAISMDQLIIAVEDAVVVLRDEVLLLGSPARGEPDSQEWAAVTGTIAHEILTGLGGRMDRRHTNQRKGLSCEAHWHHLRRGEQRARSVVQFRA